MTSSQASKGGEAPAGPELVTDEKQTEAVVTENAERLCRDTGLGVARPGHPEADKLVRSQHNRVKEMIRVTRPGGVIGVQDQDFGTLACKAVLGPQKRTLL